MRDNQGRWRLWMAMGALIGTGCDGLWTPFLMERDSSEVGASDGSTEPDLAETEVRPKLVPITQGQFQMGSPKDEVGRGTDEVDHQVRLNTNFWMAESEITQRQYRNLMGINPSSIMGDNRPVEKVSWYDAVAYCNALSVNEKLQPCYRISGMTVDGGNDLKCTGYRLPTEAEWEFAANPPMLPRTIFAGSNKVDEVAWSGNAVSSTQAVKTKAPNGRGLYDLSGNVWEWVWDWYQADYGQLPGNDPTGPVTGSERVIRGGSWNAATTKARIAQRFKYAPTIGSGGDLGFRVVRSNPSR